MTIDFSRTFMDLTEAEVREIVNSIFSPKKITCFRKLKNCFRMKIYTEWNTTDDCGQKETYTIGDEIVLRDPWEYNDNAIDCDFVDRNDIHKLKQFCFAKGICSYANDNPYMQ